MTAPFQPGQRLTEERLNTGLLIGRLVFVAERSATQNISSQNTPVVSDAIQWDTPALDILGAWTGGQPSRFTPPVAGWYEMTGYISYASSTGGAVRGTAWFLNGSQHRQGRNVTSTPASVVSGAYARTLPIALNGTSDYVELVGLQNSLANLATVTGTNIPNIAAVYRGPL